MENKTQKNLHIKIRSHVPRTHFLNGIKTVSAILKIENLLLGNLIKVKQTKQRHKL